MNMLVHDLGFSHRACDRCHGQKLRCRRENNSDTCVRCARAGVRCTPRPMRLRSRAQSAKSTQQQQSQPHANGDSTRQHHVNQEQGPNDTNDEHSDHFDYLPTSLLDMPTDLNLGGMDSSSLQADIHPALTAPYGPGGSLHTSQTSGPQAPSHLRTVEQAGQTRWSDAPNPDTSDDLYDFSLPATMRSSFPTTYHRHRGSLSRNMSPQQAHQPGQDDMMVDFDQTGGNSKGSDGKELRPDSGYGNELSPSDLLRSPYGDAPDSDSELRGNPQDQEEPSNPFPEVRRSNMTSWIRRLSDTNLQLHQHMQSIPVVGTGQRTQGSGSGNSLSPMELPVDSTFKLSSQYTGLLTSICARLESCRSCNDSETLAQLALDQPSQLLVLSSYMCLLASYDKILRHIEAWLEVRLKMGVRGNATTLDDDESSFCFPTQLPNLAVGSFEVPKTSSIQSLVLTCIMETNVMHMHSLISEIMRPISNPVAGPASKSAASGPPAAEKRPMNGVADAGDGLSTVAKVTLQAIEANEDSTLQLVHTVSKLALQRVML
ncbi:Zn(II)2Cys6 domain-containing transcription factor fumR [Aspergillus novofumigatus IBT 16806]|uniref:Putative C6 finger transcription factor n=1 Tax=Aspergillus novofumigatus (strain IBT 16806) TaxID=1392255 RepID=A0A2I1BX86_ASPN1|nr:putative C6 finger transcription factor [Aspergillus novofumigatus IBT 16806]PKX89977.1 putative C6 finger transcription factor [Aspergillus novofumigatus IBT 16806]